MKSISAGEALLNACVHLAWVLMNPTLPRVTWPLTSVGDIKQKRKFNLRGLLAAHNTCWLQHKKISRNSKLVSGQSLLSAVWRHIHFSLALHLVVFPRGWLRKIWYWCKFYYSLTHRETHAFNHLWLQHPLLELQHNHSNISKSNTQSTSQIFGSLDE